MANIVRWEPFRDMLSLRQAMDRLFDESFVRPANGWSVTAPVMPEVDVYQTDDEIVVTATIAGVRPEDIQVNVVGEVLTIEGEVREALDVDQANYLVRERRHGTFSRRFSLPTPVNAEQAQAEFDSGVLTLTLPKVEAVKPKSIKIKSK